MTMGRRELARSEEINPFGLTLADVAILGVLALGGLFVYANWQKWFGVIPSGPPKPGVHYFRMATDHEPYILPGGTLHILFSVQHMGPAGSVVLGWEPAPINPFCALGQHNATFQTVEAGLSVNADGNWTEYRVNAEALFNGWAGLYDTHQYIRDYNGVALLEYWDCDRLGV